MAKVHHAKKIGGKQIINLGSVGNGTSKNVSQYINDNTTISVDNFFVKNLSMSGNVAGSGMWPAVTYTANISYSNKIVSVGLSVTSGNQVINQSLSGILYMII